jgi:FKBP-type peptidyl-prolyl cis-trans isomerase SlyD
MNDVANENADNVVSKNSVVTFHYQLFSVEDAGERGELMESSYDDSAVVYLHGHNNIVRGLETAMSGRGSGEGFSVTISPEQGYGLRSDEAVQRIPCKHVHEYKKGKTFRPGQVVTVQTNQGARQVIVLKAGKFNLDVDFNHPLAGETLHYEIKIEDVRQATAEELSHGHAHGPGGHHH